MHTAAPRIRVLQRVQGGSPGRHEDNGTRVCTDNSVQLHLSGGWKHIDVGLGWWCRLCSLLTLERQVAGKHRDWGGIFREIKTDPEHAAARTGDGTSRHCECGVVPSERSELVHDGDDDGGGWRTRNLSITTQLQYSTARISYPTLCGAKSSGVHWQCLFRAFG